MEGLGLKILHIDLETIGLADYLNERSETTPTGCREWRGVTRKKYGVACWKGRQYAAHRISLMLAVGPPPVGKPQALHHCDNPPCINPEHLYWGDVADNRQDASRRGRASGGRAGATHCIHGHEFTPDNTYWDPRGWGRACKACQLRRTRESRQRRKAMAV
jgi:hypothetical protein